MSDLVVETISLNRILLNSAPDELTPTQIGIIQTLLAYLQIQAGGSQPSPFLVRPVICTASVIAVYCIFLLSLARRCLPTYNSQLSIVIRFLGSFTAASLTSLLLAPSLWWLPFVFCFPLMAPELLPFFKNLYEHCLRRFRGLLRRRVAPGGLLPIYNNR